MPDYFRRLPHYHPEKAYLFLTWRLWGTLPKPVNQTYPSPAHAFLAQDRALDRNPRGPL